MEEREFTLSGSKIKVKIRIKTSAPITLVRTVIFVLYVIVRLLTRVVHGKRTGFRPARQGKQYAGKNNQQGYDKDIDNPGGPHGGGPFGGVVNTVKPARTGSPVAYPDNIVVIGKPVGRLDKEIKVSLPVDILQKRDYKIRFPDDNDTGGFSPVGHVGKFGDVFP
jgi:hypothetical protein